MLKYVGNQEKFVKQQHSMCSANLEHKEIRFCLEIHKKYRNCRKNLRESHNTKFDIRENVPQGQMTLNDIFTNLY